MITSIAVLFLGITFSHWTAHSVSAAGEQVKITVNEHFNGEIGNVLLDPNAEKLSPLHVMPNSVHQGANFYFNPRLVVSSDYVTGHIEAVINSLQDNNKTSLTEFPLASQSTTTPDQTKLIEAPEVTTEKYASTETVEIIKPPFVTENNNILIEEPLEILPHPTPIIHEETIVNIPDAPILSPFNLSASIIVDERPAEAIVDPAFPSVALPEPSILGDETIIETPMISEIPAAPVLSPLELPIFPEHFVVEEIHKPKPCLEEVIMINDELFIPKPQKLFGLLSLVSIFKQKCKTCQKLRNTAPVGIQELPLILSDIVKTIPSGKQGKTIVLLPTISELPLSPIPKLPLDVIISEKSNNAQIVFPTTCAHNIIAERIVPNIILSEKTPKHLKLLSVPTAFKFPFINKRK